MYTFVNLLNIQKFSLRFQSNSGWREVHWQLKLEMPFSLISAMLIFLELTRQLLQLKFPNGKIRMKLGSAIINFLTIKIRYWQRFLRGFLEKTFPSAKPAHSAFAIAVCTSILNPESDRIQLSEESMKVIYNNHLVSIII